MLAACSAKRWLARYAAGVTRINSQHDSTVSASMRLVSCLPALKHVEQLNLPNYLIMDNLNCLLEALAWCPRLEELCLSMFEEDGGVPRPFPDAPAFAKLRSLRRLQLAFGDADPYILAGVAGALAPLTGLEELSIGLFRRAVLPAALGKLTQLHELHFAGLNPCSLEAGCLDLPSLQSLVFHSCNLGDAELLPGVTALQSLTYLQFIGGQGPRFLDPQLERLPQLQVLMLETSKPCHGGARLGLATLPADMGSLTLSLRHLSISGHGLTRFPLALTQLVALECLNACGNEFAELPAGITALSRLTELKLGRIMSHDDPVQLQTKRPLDVRALGDLSAFPALCALGFSNCEVLLCESLLGVTRHASLTSLTFHNAHPAPECTLVVLQLGQVLRRLRRGSMLRLCNDFGLATGRVIQALAGEEQLSPFKKFKAALEACGCEASMLSMHAVGTWGYMSSCV